MDLISPYDFRHGRTTHLASSTNNLAGVSYLVGHRDISTTARYVHANERHAREVLRAIASNPVLDEGPAVLPMAVGAELLMDSCGPVDGSVDPNSANYAVRKEGIEPSRELPHRNLNPARLPVPPLSLAGPGSGVTTPLETRPRGSTAPRPSSASQSRAMSCRGAPIFIAILASCASRLAVSCR